MCVECQNLYHATMKDDPEYRAKRAASTNAWRKANPEKVRAHFDAWLAKNQEKFKAGKKAWAAANPDKVREHSRKKRAKNPQKCRDAVKRWEERNPEKAKAVSRARAHNRRARELGNGGSATGAEIAAIRELQRGRCAMCKAKGKLHLDHIIPLARGGTSFANNPQFLCVSCNQSKAARDPIEWAQSRGALL